MRHRSMYDLKDPLVMSYYLSKFNVVDHCIFYEGLHHAQSVLELLLVLYSCKQ